MHIHVQYSLSLCILGKIKNRNLIFLTLYLHRDNCHITHITLHNYALLPISVFIYYLLLNIYIHNTLLSLHRYKFPAIFLVYYLVSPIVIDITFVIRILGQDKLLCSSADLLYTLQHSTQFCTFSGKIITEKNM